VCAAGKQFGKAAAREVDMDRAMDVATIGVVFFCSLGVALLLEWVSLEVLLKMMPARPQTQTTAQKYPAIVTVHHVSMAGGTRIGSSSNRRAA
jgi:hypothetical protein